MTNPTTTPIVYPFIRLRQALMDLESLLNGDLGNIDKEVKMYLRNILMCW